MDFFGRVARWLHLTFHTVRGRDGVRRCNTCWQPIGERKE